MGTGLTLNNVSQDVVPFLMAGWWLWLPALLGAIFYRTWLHYIHIEFLKKMRWVLLRVRTPRDLIKTPKSMEQVFSAAYSTFSHGLRFSEYFWDGRMEDWTSFELAGDSGGVNFYIRTLVNFRVMFEAAVYAQYPDAEIDVVEDYTELMPSVLPNKTYDVWGGDIILTKEDAYPIRTYAYWEERAIVQTDQQEAKRGIDTMAAVLEVFSRLKEGEMIWYQIIIRPTDDKWKKEAEKERDKIWLKEKKKKSGFLFGANEFFLNLLKAPFSEPTWADVKEEKVEKPSTGSLTPGQQEQIKAIETKIGKLGFESIARYIYIARRDVFSRDTINGMHSSIRQYNTFDLNSLRLLKKSLPVARQPFKSQKNYYRKRKLYDNFRLRRYSKRNLATKTASGMFCMLNIEELATIYHYPTTLVEAPMLRRVEAKKSEPPASLPTE